MTTTELLAECEAMLKRLEEAGEKATPGRWELVHGDEQAIWGTDGLEVGRMPDSCNSFAVCVWKRIAERQVAKWRIALENIKCFSSDAYTWRKHECERSLATLHAELKEATDGN